MSNEGNELPGQPLGQQLHSRHSRSRSREGRRVGGSELHRDAFQQHSLGTVDRTGE